MRYYVLLLALCFSVSAVQATSWQRHLRGFAKHSVEALPWVGPAMKDFLFGSDVDTILGIQRSLLKTSLERQSTLKQAAEELLTLKKTIERWDSLRRSGTTVARSLRKLDYTKALLGLSQEVLGISLDPSHYIPQTPYTRALKKRLRVRCGTAMGRLQHTAHFVERTRKALVALPPRSYREHQTALQEASAYEQHFGAYTTGRKLALAQHYERQAEVLLKSTAALQATLEQSEEQLSLAEQLNAYQRLHEHVRQAGQLKARATALLEESVHLHAEEQAALEAAEARAFAAALIQTELSRK